MKIYRCALCGNVVSLLFSGGGELTCCGRVMEEQIPSAIEASVEKHLPVFEREGTDLIVRVGEEPHPMTEEHRILWVALIEGEESRFHFFSPGDDPVVAFSSMGESFDLYAYCNLHGLWKNSSEK